MSLEGGKIQLEDGKTREKEQKWEEEFGRDSKEKQIEEENTEKDIGRDRMKRRKLKKTARRDIFEEEEIEIESLERHSEEDEI